MKKVPFTGVVPSSSQKQKADDEKLTSSNPPQSQSKQQPATTPSVKPPDIDSEAVATMQKQFGLINMDGKIWVFDRNALDACSDQGIAEKLILSNRSDGALLVRRALRAQYPKADAKEIVKEFWDSDETICYSGVEFNPKSTSDKYLNLWIGPTIKPISGDWSLISLFLLEIICNGDEKAYGYLKRYIAHALQSLKKNRV